MTTVSVRESISIIRLMAEKKGFIQYQIRLKLSTNLETSAFYFPNRTTLGEDFTEFNYTHLNDSASRIATALIKLGVRSDDSIGIFSLNSPDWIVVYFSIL